MFCAERRYEKTKCYVLQRNKMLGEFEVQTEIQSGCILSLTLFLRVISGVLHAAE